MTETIPHQDTLTNCIVQEVQRQATEEKLRDLVSEKVGKTIESAVDDALRSYGPVGKQITEVIRKSLELGEGRLDLPAYGHMVMAVLRSRLSEVLDEQLAETMNRELNGILKISPKEIKLTDVVEAMRDELDEHDRHGTYMTCIVDRERSATGYALVHLDTDENVDEWETSVRVGVNGEGVIHSLCIGRRDVDNTVKLGSYLTYHRMLFSAYCSGAKLIIDDDEPHTGIGDF